MIEAGADVNAKYTIENPFRDETAMHAAALKGDMVIARLLLDAKARFGTPAHQRFSRTVLQCAVQGNCTMLVHTLIAEGADPNARAAESFKSYFSLTALEVAFARGSINIDIVSALISAGADVNKIARWENSYPLRLAALKRNVEAVKLLLQAGACIDLMSKDKKTALQAAVLRRNTDLIQILLDAGADVNTPAGPEYGATALQSAAQLGPTEIVRLLLARGADVNAPAGHSHSTTALQGATMNGHLKIVLMLLKAGAQVSAPPASLEGRMALDAAAEHGHLDMVHLLLKNDDDANTIEFRCKRAAEFAASEGRHVIARILREHRTG